MIKYGWERLRLVASRAPSPSLSLGWFTLRLPKKIQSLVFCPRPHRPHPLSSVLCLYLCFLSLSVLIRLQSDPDPGFYFHFFLSDSER